MVENCDGCMLMPKSDPIIETDFWLVSLAPDQGYLGRSFVTLKEHKGDLADLTAAEWNDFSKVIKSYEGAVRKAFAAKLFNWSCLMNRAFLNNPAKPHIHWHVRPRYSTDVQFQGIKFTDPQFGHHYDRKHLVNISEDIKLKISKEIKKNLNV